MNPSIHEILSKYWGYDSFRPLQEDIIQSVLDGNDTLALLPTGGGKSICFQVPALALDGLCIVISPLIALMKDQVFNLKKHGINAVSITSGMTRRAIDIALDNCIYGTVKFLYVSPERLKTDLFAERLKKMKVGLLAVDEAHCISQWGYDFRLPYLEIAKIKELIPDVPTIALTASATDIVVNDIQDKLEFKPDRKKTFRKSFARKNLHYATQYTEDKRFKLLELLETYPGTAVVYVRSRQKTQEIAKFLYSKGISADFYHAGLIAQVRSKKQEQWIKNETRVIVSTNAFGMGIDKPDVRLVVHMDIPPDLESYYQEAGRAGRDEKPAHAVLLYDLLDIKNLKERLEQQNPPSDFIRHIYQAIANHFRIAIGSGELESYSFDIDLFCKKYKLKRVPVYYAIKKLENQGFLELNDAFSNASKVMFRMFGQELYQYQLQNLKKDFLIQLLLRMYGGEMSTHFVPINEAHIGREMNWKEEEVRTALNELQQQKVLEYDEQTHHPKIILLTPRKDAKSLSLNKKILAHQRELAENKMTSIINYAENQRRCRTQMILEYFDEITDEKCGNCDFCLGNSRNSSVTNIPKNIKSSILELLGNQPLSTHQIKQHFHKNQVSEIGSILRELMDIGSIEMDGEQRFKLK